jgi:hypothetical protein
LEHVDWRRAVAGLCGMARRVFTVTQENPAGFVGRPRAGTLAALDDQPPHLVDRGELMAEFGERSFELRRTSTREVRDGKKMVGLDFRRRP